MSFDSVFMISVFLPLTVLLNWLLRKDSHRNVMLFAAGLVFYALGSFTGYWGQLSVWSVAAKGAKAEAAVRYRRGAESAVFGRI